MLIEYPDYYSRFRCTGSRCPDSCCIGWEVDVDSESALFYRKVPGAFGDRLREHLKYRPDPYDGPDNVLEAAFPLLPDHRCPFLDRQNLCDIFSQLGEEHLCRVCTEYPRDYREFGNYLQADMSLSCPEVGRLVFTDPDPVIRYVLSENAGEDSPLPEDEEDLLATVLALRNRLLDGIFSAEYRPDLLPWEWMRSLVLGTCSELTGLSLPEESPEALAGIMETVVPIEGRRFPEMVSAVKQLLTDPPALREAGLRIHTPGMPAAGWFRKLAAYYVFRYTIDAVQEEGLEPRLLLISRSLRMTGLLCLAHLSAHPGADFTVQDMIRAAGEYSREIEHADCNLKKISGFVV